MTNQSNELRVADGQITKLVASEGDLHISFRNWKEESEDIVFHDVVGIEVFNANEVILRFDGDITITA